MATEHGGAPKFATVLYEKKGPIAYITLNRPDKLNAASDQMVEDVNDALFAFDADEDLHVAQTSDRAKRHEAWRKRR